MLSWYFIVLRLHFDGQMKRNAIKLQTQDLKNLNQVSALYILAHRIYCMSSVENRESLLLVAESEGSTSQMLLHFTFDGIIFSIIEKKENLSMR